MRSWCARVIRRHTEYRPDATAVTGWWDQQRTVESTRDRPRTKRIALGTELHVLLRCFAAFHVPGQTARVRGFGIGDQQNSREKYPEILKLYCSHPIVKLCSGAEFVGDLHYHRWARTNATANEVSATKIGAQIPSDNTDNAISGNSLTRGAPSFAERLDRDFHSLKVWK